MTETTERPRRIVRRIGTVTSDRMDKTVTVKVERLVRHPLYRKYVKRYTTLHAHDEENAAKTGDVVEVVFGRPLSKTKRWRLERVVTSAPGGAA